MYNKVLIPLDGSKLAESALPHLEEIARGCNIPEILLVSVTEPLRGKTLATEGLNQDSETSYNPLPIQSGTIFSGLIYSSEPVKLKSTTVTLGKMGKTAIKYLENISGELAQKGFRTKVNVLIGDPAEEIVRFAEETNADLIIMASRGKSGFSRWDMGHIAEKVVRAAKMPVLLVKPEAGFKETKSKRRGKPS